MGDPFGRTEQNVLDPTLPRRGLPWQTVVLLIWCALEGTVFAFTLRPTMSELISDLVGFTVNPIALLVLLSIFLTVIVTGSFACIHALNDAITAKHFGTILQMILVQLSVAIFQVLFLYRALIDDLAPWLAQGGMALGAVGTLALASIAWVAVRGMTWYLFGRSGAAALVPLLGGSARTNR